MKFKPHTAVPKARLYNKLPNLLFTPQAAATMAYYVDECSDEIGWLGIVEKYEDEMYLCTEVHLLEQEVNGGTTEISPMGLVKMAEELGLEKMQKIFLWGHSHVNMGVSPSGQDETQMKLFMENGMEWFFRIICNKKGDIGVTFYNYKENYVVEDVPWDVYYETGVEKAAIVAEMKEKVKKKTYYSPPSANTGRDKDKWRSEYRSGYGVYGGYGSYDSYSAYDGWPKYDAKKNTITEPAKKDKRGTNKKAKKPSKTVVPITTAIEDTDTELLIRLQNAYDDVYALLCEDFNMTELYEIAKGDETYKDDTTVMLILARYAKLLGWSDIVTCAADLIKFEWGDDALDENSEELIQEVIGYGL